MTAHQPTPTAYRRPTDIETARSLLDEYNADAKLTAGGQSLSLLLRQGLLDPEVIIDIAGVPDLSGIEVTDETVMIGAVTTYAELSRHPISNTHTVLGDAVKVIADEQVRNMGTVGGAVSHADPSLDIIPPLLCLNATVHIGSVDDTRTVPLSEFNQGYMATDLDSSELVEALSFEHAADGWGSNYTKHSNVEGGWATVGVGSRVQVVDGTVETARVSLAAVGDTPLRAPTVEETLVGAPADTDRIEDAAEQVLADIDPIADLSGSVEYKEQVAHALTRRSLERAVARAGSEE